MFKIEKEDQSRASALKKAGIGFVYLQNKDVKATGYTRGVRAKSVRLHKFAVNFTEGATFTIPMH